MADCVMFYGYDFNINILQETQMEKFRIPSIPHSTTKSIRFPNDIIEQVEESSAGNDCTFTAFVVEAVRVALVNLASDCEE
jgi:hypothetical protein